jgi:C-terminal processing protease CtpA/Prc
MKRKAIRIFSLTALVAALFVPFWCQPSPDGPFIQNLRAFAKLYGYIRYFHPSDEAAQVDWEKFAVIGVERVKKAGTSKELKSILKELFLPMAPTAQIYLNGETPQDPPPSWPKKTTTLNVVAWQHRGVGSGSANSPYASIRINRANMLKVATMPAVLTQVVDAAPYVGREIKLKAFVKLDGKDNERRGYLWLRVDRQNNQMGFFDNMGNRPIRASAWKEFEITGKVDEDAIGIAFGAMTDGGERLWLDGFELLVRDEKGLWKTVPIKNPGFEDGLPDQAPAAWAAPSQGYHYKISRRNAAKDKQCLMIEPAVLLIPAKLFDKIPAVGEMIQKKLTGDIFCRIPLTLYSDEKETVGKNDLYPFDPWTKSQAAKKIGDWTANNESVRLADAVIAWNIFEHFYPYFDVVGVDWDRELSWALQKALEDKTEKDFFQTLSLMVAHLKDGHGNVFSAQWTAQAGLPFAVEWIENQVAITASAHPARFQRGDIILSMDGVTAEAALTDAEQYLSGSPQWKRFKALSRFGAGEEGIPVKLKIKRSGKILDVNIPRYWKQPVLEPKRPAIDKVENGIYYVDLDRSQWQEIAPKIQELSAAKGVIFDLRGYPKNNHFILCHLLKANDASGQWMQIPQVIYPDREKIAGYDKSGWFLGARQPKIKGKVAFITDGRAISYAESFMSFVEHYKLGAIVGQPTAGTNGNVNSFELPGGFRIAWTGMKVVKHDGSQHHLIGIRPTVPMKRTFKGVFEGRDELFEKALEVVKK